MESDPNQKRLAQFGPYQADLRTGELRKHGIRLRLQEQPFQVLSMLLLNPGELVTREQLQKRLWPSDTFVDFDHGLNTAINKLREVLSDSSATPKYIETLPRRGYRFVANVDFVNGTTGAPVTDAVSAQVQAGAATTDDPLPKAPRSIARALFLVLQAMYLVFYFVTLLWHDRIAARLAVRAGKAPDDVAARTLAGAIIGVIMSATLPLATAGQRPDIGQTYERIDAALALLEAGLPL